MSILSRAAVVGLVPFALAGWAGGRGDSAPLDVMGGQTRKIDLSKVEGSELIRYRELTPEDFKGTEPPPQLASHGSVLGAAICTFLMPNPDSILRATADWSEGEEPEFEAVAENLGFHAAMDRSCSWWNHSSSLSAEYRLEHEQVHFALSEIAARKLDRRAKALGKELRATAASAEVALEQLSQRIDQELAEAMREVAERGAQLDRETSVVFRPERQRWWRQKVKAELEEAGREQR